MNNLIPEGLDINQIVVLSKFGSHLYGTDTEESDEDYKGIYLPTHRQVILNEIPKTYSLPKTSGVDLQIWSLHHWFKLACQGEAESMDLLHAPKEAVILKNRFIWSILQANKSKFYKKNMNAYLGYARKQAHRYCERGSRIKALKTVIDVLKEYDPELKLKHIWDYLPQLFHIHKIYPYPDGSVAMYQVCGKKVQETCTIGYALNIYEKALSEYGDRAKLAELNKGVDWKAVSHACRIASQLIEMATQNTITFPLWNAKEITEIKQGKWDWITQVQPYVESLMEKAEYELLHCDLPVEIDKKYLDDLLIKIVREYVL